MTTPGSDRARHADDAASVRVVALYAFVAIDDGNALKARLDALCRAQGLRGTLLLAHEGINGTVAGSHGGVQALLDLLAADGRFGGLDWKESFAPARPFHRMKVRWKDEIVTIGRPDVDPTRRVGTYVDAAGWNALLADPDVVVIDTRNHYEVRLGTFPGAIDPLTQSFSEFPAFVERALDPAKHRKVAMFCTGGIRCEKASSLMLDAGFEQVFHLKGGILRYLETTPADQSRWQGDCFVFDERVAVTHGLAPTAAVVCFNCRMPLTVADQADSRYERDVSCPHCADGVSDTRRAGLRERARQLALALERGEEHIGDIAPIIERRRAEKRARRGDLR